MERDVAIRVLNAYRNVAFGTSKKVELNHGDCTVIIRKQADGKIKTKFVDENRSATSFRIKS